MKEIYTHKPHGLDKRWFRILSLSLPGPEISAANRRINFFSRSVIYAPLSSRTRFYQSSKKRESQARTYIYVYVGVTSLATTEIHSAHKRDKPRSDFLSGRKDALLSLSLDLWTASQSSDARYRLSRPLYPRARSSIPRATTSPHLELPGEETIINLNDDYIRIHKSGDARAFFQLSLWSSRAKSKRRVDWWPRCSLQLWEKIWGAFFSLNSFTANWRDISSRNILYAFDSRYLATDFSAAPFNGASAHTHTHVHLIMCRGTTRLLN